MLAGRPAFAGDTMSDTFVSILEHEPDWAALPAATPDPIRRILCRCLQKNPRKRLHDIADALIEIEDGATTAASRDVMPADARAAFRKKPGALGWVVAAEGFTVRRLMEPVAIDGRTWIAIDSVSATGPLRAPNGQFTLTLEEAKEHAGDVVRFRVFFAEGARRIQLDPGVAAYAYISPDSRWIVSDPLEIVDVLNWRRYSLSTLFKIDPYVVLRAISADRRRLYVSRQPCAFDCQHLPHEYFEIGFPSI